MDNHKDAHKISDLFKKMPVATTTDVANHLSVSWNTAEKILLELTIDGKVRRIKKAGVNLWLLAKN